MVGDESFSTIKIMQQIQTSLEAVKRFAIN